MSADSKTLTDHDADKVVLRLIISRLEHDTYTSKEISAENQGALVRASNRVARRLKEWLRFKEKGNYGQEDQR